jgi:hypothetical protein
MAVLTYSTFSLQDLDGLSGPSHTSFTTTIVQARCGTAYLPSKKCSPLKLAAGTLKPMVRVFI